MNKEILKSYIVELVGSIDDQRFLESMSAMLEAYVGKTALSAEEKAAIEEGLKDMEEGRTISHEQLKKDTASRYPNLRLK